MGNHPQSKSWRGVECAAASPLPAGAWPAPASPNQGCAPGSWLQGLGENPTANTEVASTPIWAAECPHASAFPVPAGSSSGVRGPSRQGRRQGLTCPTRACRLLVFLASSGPAALPSLPQALATIPGRLPGGSKDAVRGRLGGGQCAFPTYRVGPCFSFSDLEINFLKGKVLL